MNTALTQVLGAVAYGEWKAYEGAKAEAEATDDPELRRRHRVVAAEELRHHKGFVSRLEAMGADPDRAMRPFRATLDRYHGRQSDDPVAEAVVGYLGEGVAADLLHWLRKVVDDDTATFIDTVIADEVGHEADAAADLRAVLDSEPHARAAGPEPPARCSCTWRAAVSPAPGPCSRSSDLGRPDELIRSLLAGHVRRMRAVGLAPFGLPVPALLDR